MLFSNITTFAKMESAVSINPDTNALIQTALCEMIFVKCYPLSPCAFDTLLEVNLEQLGDHIVLDRITHSLSTDRFTLLLILLNEEIAARGMTPDQEHVNDYGVQLYMLYDELYAQK